MTTVFHLIRLIALKSMPTDNSTFSLFISFHFPMQWATRRLPENWWHRDNRILNYSQFEKNPIFLPSHTPIPLEAPLASLQWGSTVHSNLSRTYTIFMLSFFQEYSLEQFPYSPGKCLDIANEYSFAPSQLIRTSLFPVFISFSKIYGFHGVKNGKIATAFRSGSWQCDICAHGCAVVNRAMKRQSLACEKYELKNLQCE